MKNEIKENRWVQNEKEQTVARFVRITPVKTYATEKNALLAVEKLLKRHVPFANDKLLTFTIMKDDETNRYFPLFFGERAVQAGIHFHFNIAG